jgi:hypothetical protein
MKKGFIPPTSDLNADNIRKASSWSGYGLGGGSCSIHSYHDAHEDEDEAIPNMGKDVKHNLKPL